MSSISLALTGAALLPMNALSTPGTIALNTAQAPRRTRKPKLVSVRPFTPSLEDLAAQNYDPSTTVGEALNRLYNRLSGPQQSAFLTTLRNALKMEEQGYRLQPLGQMRYRVHSGKGQLRPYVYDHAAETCTCDLFPVIGACKHSVFCAWKLGEAQALLPQPKPAGHNPWALPPGEPQPYIPSDAELAQARRERVAASIGRDF